MQPWACLCLALVWITAVSAEDQLKTAAPPATRATPTAQDFVVVPNATNAVQFRLYTSASPDSPHLFNTFDLLAFGQPLLQSPAGDELRRGLALPAVAPFLHSLLINGQGPNLAATNGLALLGKTSGPDWCYLGLDGTAAYRDRVTRLTRGILFVEPDLFVLHDHLEATEPVSYRMLLHPPASTKLDPDWGDLRLESPTAACRINTPGRGQTYRFWSRIESEADAILPGTITTGIGPTNKLAHLDVVTVFAVYPRDEKRTYAFKLLESNTAVGAQIHRQGLPTLIAFKTDALPEPASLIGFRFQGPAGVYVFQPKPRP